MSGGLNDALASVGLDPLSTPVSKPIMMNEGALSCHPTTDGCTAAEPPAGWDNDLANYVLRHYVRAWATGHLNGSWYTFHGDGWRWSGLHGDDEMPTNPGYNALAFLATTLAGGSYLGQLANGPALEGDQFQAGGYRYDVYWANDDSYPVVGFPATPLAIYDEQGAVLCEGTCWSVWFIYFEQPIIVKLPG
ncbi:MAG: hypothetical protein ACRDIB_18105 [Ardenticatenaceae bacterium]